MSDAIQSPDTKDILKIRGAREHNLKNIDLDIPRNKLVVISGLSGSGKSSLAFDTVFAEGQRRYVESLSAYARQFLGRMDKPDLDLIEGLSPAISIEQKTTHRNPRSTVGTVTEIYDYYRLLFARIGKAHCPNCGKEIKEQTVDQIIDTVMSWQEGEKIQILSPVVRGKKGEHAKILEDAIKDSFLRARIDGIIIELDQTIKLDKQKKHSIELVIDRIVLSKEVRKRLADSIETALAISSGLLIVLREAEEVFFSQKNACPDCGISMPELQPRLFSFNNPFGACPECTGLGEKMEYDFDLIVPDTSKSFNEHAFLPYNPESAWNYCRFEAIANSQGFSLDTPVSKLTKKQLDALMNGTKESIKYKYIRADGSGQSTYNQPWDGMYSDLKRRYNETYSDAQRLNLEKYMAHRVCESCKGRRLNPQALAVLVNGKNIYEISELSVLDSIRFFDTIKLTETEVSLSGKKTSQYFSSLSIAGALNPEGLIIHCTDDLSEKPYLDITLEMMKAFCVLAVHEDYKTIRVFPKQEFRPQKIRIEGDYSSASYFFLVAAITGIEVKMPYLKPDSVQGDKKIIDFMQEMGCTIWEEGDALVVKGGNLKAVDIDCLNTPDIVPTLAVAAAFAEGESVLRNISQLRYKESDRISAIQSELGKMGIKTALKGEDLCIFGSPKEIHSAIIDSHNDHRIAMSFAVPGLILEGQKIMHPSCVAKSFPHFWELFDGIFTQ